LLIYFKKGEEKRNGMGEMNEIRKKEGKKKAVREFRVVFISK
jgi:hypothetical protein